MVDNRCSISYGRDRLGEFNTQANVVFAVDAAEGQLKEWILSEWHLKFKGQGEDSICMAVFPPKLGGVLEPIEFCGLIYEYILFKSQLKGSRVESSKALEIQGQDYSVIYLL